MERIRAAWSATERYRRALLMATAAWLANDWARATSSSGHSRSRVWYRPMTPSAWSWLTSGTRQAVLIPSSR